MIKGLSSKDVILHSFCSTDRVVVKSLNISSARVQNDFQKLPLGTVKRLAQKDWFISPKDLFLIISSGHVHPYP